MTFVRCLSLSLSLLKRVFPDLCPVIYSMYTYIVCIRIYNTRVCFFFLIKCFFTHKSNKQGELNLMIPFVASGFLFFRRTFCRPEKYQACLSTWSVSYVARCWSNHEAILLSWTTITGALKIQNISWRVLNVFNTIICFFTKCHLSEKKVDTLLAWILL